MEGAPPPSSTDWLHAPSTPLCARDAASLALELYRVRLAAVLDWLDDAAAGRAGPDDVPGGGSSATGADGGASAAPGGESDMQAALDSCVEFLLVGEEVFNAERAELAAHSARYAQVLALRAQVEEASRGLAGTVAAVQARLQSLDARAEKAHALLAATRALRGARLESDPERVLAAAERYATHPEEVVARAIQQAQPQRQQQPGAAAAAATQDDERAADDDVVAARAQSDAAPALERTAADDAGAESYARMTATGAEAARGAVDVRLAGDGTPAVAAAGRAHAEAAPPPVRPAAATTAGAAHAQPASAQARPSPAALLGKLPLDVRKQLLARLPPGWRPGMPLPADLPDLTALVRQATAAAAAEKRG